MASQLVYPVRVEARLDENLSRWLWLVKWFLAIPHYVVLAFLWLAFVVSSVAAFFAILFTGRYPRAIFDFNVGVLRWNWRVAYYAYGALATDRYPPFTLDEVADYPVHLSIEYQQKLSRGLVLVKWWLLAIPHYIIVGLLVGGVWVAVEGDNWKAGGFGLISLLTLVAGGILLFTGRYPAQLFDFLLGLNRWVLRVAAYAGLMTDVYPPFRLDAGGSEPGAPVTMNSGIPPAGTVAIGQAAVGPTSAAESGSGWTAGPVISLVAGSLIGLLSLGFLVAGVAVYTVDSTQREDGFVMSPSTVFDTGGYAVVAESLEIEAEGPEWVLPDSIVGDARVRATGTNKPVFVGIGPSSDVDRYLSGVSYSQIPDLSREDGRSLPATSGGAPAAVPASQPFWVASSEGEGTQSIEWPVSTGSWSVVIMNADASQGVDFRGDVGAEVPVLRPIYIGLLVVGNVLLVAAIVPIVAAVKRAGRRTGEGGGFIKVANRLKIMERSLLLSTEQATFSPNELDGLPEPVQRYFMASIAGGTPMAVSARLRMKGQIKVKKWLHFRARQVLSPHLGFVWAGRAGGVIVGSDSYFEGKGLLDWKLAGLLTVAHAEGEDVSRSAAGRGAAEAIWLPTALLPRFGVRWSAEDPNHIKAEYSLGDTPLELRLTVDDVGRVVDLVFDRWGDPDGSGSFGEHPFGGVITGHSTFHGLTIPSAGRLGWYYGTDRWPEGEFFRFDILDLEPGPIAGVRTNPGWRVGSA